MTRNLSFAPLGLGLLLGATACGSYADAESGAYAPGELAGTSSEAPGSGIQAGRLTAGAWDDNRNFDAFSAYLAEHAQLRGQPGLTAAERAAARDDFEGSRGAKGALDLALVIDTTGSMGDELGYLQVELDAISARIRDEFPDVAQRWALVVYRDEGDEYVTEKVDFTDDLAAFRRALEAQSAGGGGDFPEAADRGLAEAMELSWQSGPVARLVFWIADAPHHDGDSGRVTEAIRAARQQDIRVYPVAASGVEDLAELTMRSAAQLSGGRYLFLTDDSGIGDSHKEPTIPCYFVTRLDQAMVRMTAIELSGVYREPAEDQVLRVGGNPENGRCVLPDGAELRVF